jgi:hypothetical protein
MEDVTVIIQGRLLQESYDFYVKNYRDFPVIISTWIDNEISFKNLPPNFKVVLSQYPTDFGDQNFHLQIISTLAGLQMVKTKYSIKLRGDEYWSNPNRILKSIKYKPNKIWTSSVFFRAWQYAEYHISDHIIAGTTDNLLIMFSECKSIFDNGELNLSKWKINGKFHKWVKTHAPEERITKAYLRAKSPNTFESVDGRLLMKEHFDILDIQTLKPYKIKANLFKMIYEDFIPEKNYSISTIDQLFSNNPYENNDTNIT